MLDRFFNLFKIFRPDRHVYFNGDMFDMPYVIDRAGVLEKDIPNLSKIKHLQMIPKLESIATPFRVAIGSNSKITWSGCHRFVILLSEIPIHILGITD